MSDLKVEIPQVVQALADRIAIQDRVVRTCTSLDQRNWDAYVECYTQDATISYTHNDAVQTPAEFIAQVSPRLANFPLMQHLAVNFTVEANGGEATCQTYCVAYMGPLGRRDSGVWRAASSIYNDRLVWRGDTWLIRTRQAELQWEDGPAGKPLGAAGQDPAAV